MISAVKIPCRDGAKSVTNGTAASNVGLQRVLFRLASFPTGDRFLVCGQRGFERKCGGKATPTRSSGTAIVVIMADPEADGDEGDPAG